MRNTVLLILITAFQVNAVDSYSQNTRLSLDLNNVTVANVLEEIESQSEYFFLFNAKLIDVERKVSVSAQDQKIFDILGTLFNETGVNYLVYGKQIILSPENLVRLNQPPQLQNTVSGKVTDNTGTPLAGVTILVKGTTVGTLTDAQGNYSISLPAEAQVLVFSFVGMKSQEIEIAGQTSIDVIMAQSVESLDEVVVIGYETSVRRKDLTGAVASIQGTDIAERNVPIISQALQGTVPGLMVTRNNNAPGSTATIRIRGVTTIGDSNPLILVDGVPVNDLNDLNPNDIENVSVLKDAASASIYGARAAAGVILITTKRTKPGQLSLDYTYNTGFEQPTRLPEFANAVRYMQMVNELRWNDIGNTPGGEYPQYSKDVIDNYVTLHEQNPDIYPNEDWMGLLLKDRAQRSSHLFNISAGTEALRTRLSIGYDNIDGLYMGKYYHRITARLNNDIKINKFINSSVDFYVKRVIDENPSLTAGQVLHSALTTPPVYAAIWSNGLIADCKDGTNAYGQILKGGYVNSWNNLLGGKIRLDVSPIKDLKFTAIIAPEFGFNKEKAFLKKVPYTNWDDPNTYVGVMQWGKTNNIGENRVDFYSVTTQFLINYSKSFGNHTIRPMGGYESYYFFRESLNAASDNLVFDSYPYLDLNNPNYLANSGNAYENAYESFFGRILYDYNKKYLFQANIRVDGSSRFHKDYRWGTFPSFSAGWVISEESFMKNLSPVSFLKLRASWGMLGNERIGNYPYQATISFGSGIFYQGYNIISDVTAAQVAYAIKDISWETTETYDIGIDANFFKNKLSLNFDVYKKLTKDMLLALEIPDFMGYDNPDQNTGEMYTNGWDLLMEWRDEIGQFSYSVSANLSDSRSIMGDLGGIQFLGDMVKYEGSEFNEYYGYKSEGLFKTENEVTASPVPFAGIKPGDIKYKDISGPNGEPDGKISADYDRVLLGGSLPRYMYGGNINLGYRNFDLSLIFQGVGKMNSVWTNNMRQPYQSKWRNMPMTIDGKYWSVYNTEEQNNAAELPRLTDTNGSNNYAMSDFWMFNGSYFRLKNVILGYTIPQKIANKILMQSCRFYVSISDLLSIDKYPKGWDPEVANTGYPITTSFIFGASVKF